MEKEKNKIFQFVSNSFSFIIFSTIKIFFPQQKTNENNILFINTGKIGDLIVTSILLENDDIFNNDFNVYLLIKQQYYPLFEKYSGKINIISYKYDSYKWSLFYRIKLLKKLNKLKIEKCFNITSARGMLNDEISLLCGANNIYTTCSNHIYLGKFLGTIMDSKYTEIIYSNIYNEYDKHIEVLKSFSGKKEFIFYNHKTFHFSNLSQDKDYIAISPLSTDKDRSWGIGNYKTLCNEISKTQNVILLGSKSEIDKLNFIKAGNNNISIDISPLDKVTEIINSCKLYIGNHSGLTHIALKLNKPLIAILDGGFFNQYLPYKTENKNNIFIYNEMECFGCLMRCLYKEKYCLTNITIEEVYKEFEKLVNRI